LWIALRGIRYDVNMDEMVEILLPEKEDQFTQD